MPRIDRRRMLMGVGLAGAGLAGATVTLAGNGAQAAGAATAVSPERMYELAYELGVAKNRQDVTTALTYMHDDIVLTSPAWGLVARGKKENGAALNHLFANYPDYEVSFDGHVADPVTFIGWGKVRMTLAADGIEAQGLSPNGKRIEIPVTIRMTFKDDLIATEHFLCDLAQIATQSGVSIDGLRKNIFGA